MAVGLPNNRGLARGEVCSSRTLPWQKLLFFVVRPRCFDCMPGTAAARTPFIAPQTLPAIRPRLCDRPLAGRIVFLLPWPFCRFHFRAVWFRGPWEALIGTLRKGFREIPRSRVALRAVLCVSGAFFRSSEVWKSLRWFLRSVKWSFVQFRVSGIVDLHEGWRKEHACSGCRRSFERCARFVLLGYSLFWISSSKSVFHMFHINVSEICVLFVVR